MNPLYESVADHGRSPKLPKRLLTLFVPPLINSITYDSFGNVLSQTNAAAGDRYLFTGRELDTETGLYYYRARYYDPATGRFISQDPIGFDANDANLYRYVGNAPTNATDPTGLVTVAESSVSYSRSTLPLLISPRQCFVILLVASYATRRVVDTGLAPLFGLDPPDISEPLDISLELGNIGLDILFAAKACSVFRVSGAGSAVFAVVAVALRQSVAFAGARAAVTIAGSNFTAFAKAGDGGGGSNASNRKAAPEKQVKDIAKRIERELGPDVRRKFHDLKDKALGDRTIAEALDDAMSLYEDAGKETPQWLKDRLR